MPAQTRHSAPSAEPPANPDGLDNENFPTKPFNIVVYPNPAGNTLHVEFEGTDNPQGTITVTDITGVVHYVETPHCDVSTNGVTIVVSNLTPGLYVVSFRNGKGVVVRKFVKM